MLCGSARFLFRRLNAKEKVWNYPGTRLPANFSAHSPGSAQAHRGHNRAERGAMADGYSAYNARRFNKWKSHESGKGLMMLGTKKIASVLVTPRRQSAQLQTNLYHGIVLQRATALRC